jgi:hypothetical protein
MNKSNSLKQQGRWNQTYEQDEKNIALQAYKDFEVKGDKERDYNPTEVNDGLQRNLDGNSLSPSYHPNHQAIHIIIEKQCC